MKNIYKIMFFVSVALVAAAIVIVAVFGLRFGIDFKGGSLLEVIFEGQRPSVAELGSVVSSIPGVENVNLNPVGNNGMLIRLNSIGEETHQNILNKISDKFGSSSTSLGSPKLVLDKITENRFDSI